MLSLSLSLAWMDRLRSRWQTRSSGVKDTGKVDHFGQIALISNGAARTARATANFAHFLSLFLFSAWRRASTVKLGDSSVRLWC